MVRSTGLILFILAITIVVASFYSILIDRECKGIICRGDYPAFYSAAKLAKQNLYDRDAQRAVQNKFWPSLEGDYLFFSYPPYVAYLLQPFANYSPIQSKLLYLFCSLISLTLALLIISKQTQQSFKMLIAVMICFFPNLIGVLSGQNFAFSFLLLAVILTAIKKQKYYLAGLANGLWVFKPHFALIALLGMLACRFWRSAITTCIIFILFYLFSAYTNGWDWPLTWLDSIRFFYSEDLNRNGYQMVSILSLFEMYQLSYLGMLLVVAMLLFYVYQCVQLNTDAYLKYTPSIVLLCSPHTMPYDLGIALIPMLLTKDKALNTRILIGILSVSLIYIMRRHFYVSPLFIFPLLLLSIDYKKKQTNG